MHAILSDQDDMDMMGIDSSHLVVKVGMTLRYNSGDALWASPLTLATETTPARVSAGLSGPVMRLPHTKEIITSSWRAQTGAARLPARKLASIPTLADTWLAEQGFVRTSEWSDWNPTLGVFTATVEEA